MNPRRLAVPVFVLAAALSLRWLYMRESDLHLPVEQATAAQFERFLSPSTDPELAHALGFQTRLGPVDVQRALDPQAEPTDRTSRVDSGLAMLLSDPDPRIGLAAMEACIALGQRGQTLSAPLLSAPAPAASRALIIQSWTLPTSQARALLMEHLQGPLGPLAALELSRVAPGVQTQQTLERLLAQAPERDRALLDYASRLAAGTLYQDLPNSEM